MLIIETLALAAKDRLVACGVCGGNVDLHRDPPSKDEKLPLINVTVDVDDGAAIGDPRTGIAEFNHKLTLVVEILDTARTGPQLMTKMAQHAQVVMGALCRDLGWGGKTLEGIHGVRQVTERATEGAVPVYRRLMQFDLLYRSSWEPDTDDLPDLTQVGIATGIGLTDADGDTPAESGIGLMVAELGAEPLSPDPEPESDPMPD